MAKLKLEASWRKEFKRVAEAHSRDPSNRRLIEEPKRQANLRWRGDEAESRRLRDEQTHHYFQWILVAIVAVVIVGLIMIGLTYLH